MDKSIIVLNEPELEFRYTQKIADPRDGLTLFGPYDTDLPSKPSLPPYIVIGTDKGITDFKTWADAMNRPAFFEPKENLRLWPPFPGFEAAFCSQWSSNPIKSYPIDRDQLIEISRYSDEYERVFGVVDYYLEELKKATKLDENIGVAICVVPEEIWKHCRPKSRVDKPIQRASREMIKSRRGRQMQLFQDFNPDQYKLFPDFRRQFKARAMQYGIPLQILRESTLRLKDYKVRGERPPHPSLGSYVEH